jgi:hypothetical protein
LEAEAESEGRQGTKKEVEKTGSHEQYCGSNKRRSRGKKSSFPLVGWRNGAEEDGMEKARAAAEGRTGRAINWERP